MNILNHHSAKIFVAAVVAVVCTNSVCGFSLLGPYASYQTSGLGYRLADDVGGPMDLTEGYRWNVPVVTYGFDQTFLDYFGLYGVNAVERAIKILNSLPSTDAMSASLSEFPLQAFGVMNTAANSLSAFDLQSQTLSTLLGQLGLASPERWMYALQDRVIAGNVTNYTVIQRQFDPVNRRVTNVVNGVLYHYTVQEPLLPGNFADAREFRVSGNANNQSIASFGGGTNLPAGQFFIGLTRDDVGGLRHLLSTTNQAVETLISGVRGVGPNATNFVNAALRPGVGKVTFSRLNLDPVTRQFIPVTNQYVDTYLGPGNILMEQTLERVITRPDILFAAQSLGSVRVRVTGITNWINNANLNSFVSTDGPGVIQGPIVISLNKALPSPSVWGMFDSVTTTAIFPTTPVPAPAVTIQSTGESFTNRAFRIQIAVNAGLSYRIEATTNLVSWQPLANFVPSSGTFSYTNFTTPDLTRRYYRVSITAP